MANRYQQALENFKTAQKELEEARLLEIPSAIEDIKQKIAEFNISAEDLGFKSGAKARGTRSAKKAVQKYAQPENPEITWSGAGRKPQWVKDHLDNGGQLEDLRIKTTVSPVTV